jgi:hypothetical protein
LSVERSTVDMALIIHLQGKPYDIHSNMALCLPVGRSLGVQDELNAELVPPLWLDVHHYVVHWKCHESYT